MSQNSIKISTLLKQIPNAINSLTDGDVDEAKGVLVFLLQNKHANITIDKEKIYGILVRVLGKLYSINKVNRKKTLHHTTVTLKRLMDILERENSVLLPSFDGNLSDFKEKEIVTEKPLQLEKQITNFESKFEKLFPKINPIEDYEAADTVCDLIVRLKAPIHKIHLNKYKFIEHLYGNLYLFKNQRLAYHKPHHSVTEKKLINLLLEELFKERKVTYTKIGSQNENKAGSQINYSQINYGDYVYSWLIRKNVLLELRPIVLSTTFPGLMLKDYNRNRDDISLSLKTRREAFENVFYNEERTKKLVNEISFNTNMVASSWKKAKIFEDLIATTEDKIYRGKNSEKWLLSEKLRSKNNFTDKEMEVLEKNLILYKSQFDSLINTIKECKKNLMRDKKLLEKYKCQALKDYEKLPNLL
jgi:hypothetical protein